ncbi:hypothetical protein B0H19DRAFT_1270515 [Mycena capillaripes]|nr:hypothetical protein B0H19DRAFT_1270515 [Mycena capillaripes]
MSSVTLRRCAVIGKSNKTLYDGVLAQAEAHPQFLALRSRNLNSKLTEGTLVLATSKPATHTMKDQNKKVHYVLMDKLRILDHGDGESFVVSVPQMLAARSLRPQPNGPTTMLRTQPLIPLHLTLLQAH